MLVVIGFDLDDENVAELLENDLHGRDMLDLINDEAIYHDNRHHVWHISDAGEKKFDEVMLELFNEYPGGMYDNQQDPDQET